MRKKYSFENVEDLEAMGFRGFEKVSVLNDLRRRRKLTRLIGKEIGLYMVVCPFSHRPNLLFGYDDDLRERWIRRTIVVYIGETHRKRGGLPDCIGEYLRYGVNGYGNHAGGKAIWQIDGSDDLKFCWRAGQLIDGETPNDAETTFLDEFKKIYKHVPFANIDEKGV